MTEATAKKGLLASAALTTAGIALCGTTQATAGGVLLLAGWLAFVASLHRFGRSSDG